jgi:hypothetical protein
MPDQAPPPGISQEDWAATPGWALAVEAKRVAARRKVGIVRFNTKILSFDGFLPGYELTFSAANTNATTMTPTISMSPIGIVCSSASGSYSAWGASSRRVQVAHREKQTRMWLTIAVSLLLPSRGITGLFALLVGTDVRPVVTYPHHLQARAAGAAKVFRIGHVTSLRASVAFSPSVQSKRGQSLAQPRSEHQGKGLSGPVRVRDLSINSRVAPHEPTSAPPPTEPLRVSL